MHITTIRGANGNRQEPSRTTDAELQNEYNYILAENLTKKLLEKGLISVDDSTKLWRKIGELSPHYSPVSEQI